MANNENRHKPPTAGDVVAAYRAYQSARASYLDILTRYVTAQPDQIDPLYGVFAKDIALLRVLHALSVGYGWNDALYRVSTRAEVAQARLGGYVERVLPDDGLVLTQRGVELLQRWAEYITPLIEKHPRYRDLWRSVTALGG